MCVLESVVPKVWSLEEQHSLLLQLLEIQILRPHSRPAKPQFWSGRSQKPMQFNKPTGR